MEHRFDRLAKSVAGAVTRREALWRFGKGLGLVALAAAGVAAARQENCANCCTIACRNLDEPPRGQEMALCITHCLKTGVAIGPPDAFGNPQESKQCVPFCVEPPL